MSERAKLLKAEAAGWNAWKMCRRLANAAMFASQAMDRYGRGALLPGFFANSHLARSAVFVLLIQCLPSLSAGLNDSI